MFWVWFGCGVLRMCSGYGVLGMCSGCGVLAHMRFHGRSYWPSLGRPLSVYANAMAEGHEIMFEGREIMFEGCEIMFEGREILPFKHLEYL